MQQVVQQSISGKVGRRVPLENDRRLVRFPSPFAQATQIGQ